MRVRRGLDGAALAPAVFEKTGGRRRRRRRARGVLRWLLHARFQAQRTQAQTVSCSGVCRGSDSTRTAGGAASAANVNVLLPRVPRSRTAADAPAPSCQAVPAAVPGRAPPCRSDPWAPPQRSARDSRPAAVLCILQFAVALTVYNILAAAAALAAATPARLSYRSLDA